MNAEIMRSCDVRHFVNCLSSKQFAIAQAVCKMPGNFQARILQTAWKIGQLANCWKQVRQFAKCRSDVNAAPYTSNFQVTKASGSKETSILRPRVPN